MVETTVAMRCPAAPRLQPAGAICPTKVLLLPDRRPPEASPAPPVAASLLMALSWASFLRACALPLATSTARIDLSVEAV